MSDANPLVLAKSLDESLKRYIATTAPIHSRYPELREEFCCLLYTSDAADE